jgi:hypothetical protein
MIAGTFDLMEVFELAVMLAIPVILVILLVRSFRKPRAGARDDDTEPAPEI